MQNAPAAAPRRDLFLALAVAYLALPNVIFLLGWVRPAIGIPAALTVVGAVGWLVWQRKISAPRRPLSQPNLLLVLTLAFGWALLAGVGGLLPQSSDYLKHNLLLHDLISGAWPVTYPHAGGNTFLCYATGYYLVPALGGKILGADALPAFTFLWTFAGLILFFYWAATFTAAPRKTLAAILLFAPTGILWSLFKSHGLPGVISAAELEPKLLFDGLLFGYNDSYTRWFFQPQHALTGWLGTALLLEMLWVQKNPRGAAFAWALGVLWSPLTSLGLLLVPLAAWRRVRWQNYFEPINLLGGGALLTVLGIYFLGHVPLADKGFIGSFSNDAEWVCFYILFLGLLLTPLLGLWLVERKLKLLGEWRPLFFGAVAVLILLPLYKFGIAGDLRHQASSPAWLLLALAASRIWMSEKFSLNQPRCLLLAAVLLVGALYPVSRPLKNLLTGVPDYSYASIVQNLGWHSLADLTDPRFDPAAQYQGRSDSPAMRWLLRPTPVLPP